jgi:two-component system sensor histidine kinase KdpD
MPSRENRPDPDELLARISSEEDQKARGKLKIFLGYIAGVGKTYTMLEAARQRQAEPDIVIAYVETHGRVETEALLQGLEIIPRKQVKYRGVTLTEMDIDAVLKRHPKLALVDELAHTNIPNSRHPKRFQDVEELLDAGIDVYTTLNVQHIESLQSVVSQVTGVWVRETVPDGIINSADEIEVVDLPPDELLKRLKEGKVYIPDQAQRATEDFFRKGNLIALRELAMRTAALRINEQMRDYMEAHNIPGPWLGAERLMVCISPGHLSNLLVRNGRRLASQLRAEWFVVHIENTLLLPEEQDRLANTMRLAERMGAKTITIQGNSVSDTITDFASKNGITKIILGKSRQTGWKRFFSGSISKQIVQQSTNYDVYIVSGHTTQTKKAKTTGRYRSSNWKGYAQGLILVLATTMLGYLARDLFSSINIVMLYILCVAVTAVFWGLGPSIITSIIAVIAFDFLFMQPYLDLSLADTQYIFTFVTLLLVGMIISYLTSRVRMQNVAARRRERQTAALYALGRDLAISNDLESYINAITKRIKETLECDALIFLPDINNATILKPPSGNPDITLDEKESAAATWSFQHQKTVGHGTDTLPNAKARYVPLITARGTVGVMALFTSDMPGNLTIEQEHLIEAYADLAAVAIEGIQLAQKIKQR